VLHCDAPRRARLTLLTLHIRSVHLPTNTSTERSDDGIVFSTGSVSVGVCVCVCVIVNVITPYNFTETCDSVALLVASRYVLPGYGDWRVWVRGPGWPDHCVRL